MRLWRPTASGAWPRADLREIAELVGRDLASDGGRLLERHGPHHGWPPRVVAIASAESLYDDHLYETHVELIRGVTVSATWDATEEERDVGTLDPADPAQGNEPCIAAAAADVVRHYAALGAEHLAGLLHDLRARARRILAGYATTGGGPRLVDLRLTGDDWLHDDDVRLAIRLERLDDDLSPRTDELVLDDPARLETRLSHWGRDAKPTYALRHALEAQGATGTIDLLTLNAIRTMGSVAVTLTNLGREALPWVSNDVHIFAERGNLTSHGRDPASGLSWNRHRVHHPTVLPATVLAACVGRPVTDLITHPVLSPEMTIIRATARPNTGHLSIDIDQPRRLFCSQSGRAWATPPRLP